MQVNYGFRKILSYSAIYNLFQNLVGANHLRKTFVKEHFDIGANIRLLDIGCGTAEILAFLPKDIEYIGFDASEEYIHTAKTRWGNRGHFFCKKVTETELYGQEHFNLCIAIGLIHHLKDREVIHMFNLIASKLASRGRFVSIDPCFVSEQSFFSRAIIKCDRGMNVRTPEEMKLLAGKVFKNVTVQHRNDLLKIPYDHVILELS